VLLRLARRRDVSVRPRSLLVALCALLACAVALGQTVTTCDAACTVTMVVSLNTPFFNLDEAGAAGIAGAVLRVWALGFGIRQIIRTARDADGNSSTSEET
jgi:hypothetical protein